MMALTYLFMTTMKNGLRQLLKKPALIVVYLGVIAMMVFALIPGGKTGFTVSTDMLPILRAIAFALFGFVTYSSISKGLKQGSTFFAMPDVNFLFTSPIRPQAVLLYGVIRQMGISAMTSIFMLFQIPNMRNLLHLDGTGIFAVITGWFFMLICAQVVSLCVYSLTAPYPNRRRLGNYILYGLIGIVVLGLVGYLLSRGGDMMAVLDYFGLPVMDYVPMVGWINAYMMGLISGNTLKAVLFLLLALFFPAVGIALVQRTNSDYYEDVLQATEQSFLLRQAVKDGKGGARNMNTKVRAGKSGIVGKGQGASIFFYRHLTEQRRTGMFLLDKGSLVVIVGAIIGGIIFRNLSSQGEITPFISSLIAFAALAYILYFLTVTGKFTQELTRPFIYLVPAPPILKLFYANLTTVLKSLIEGLAAFTIIAVLAGLPWWYVPMAGLTYATLSQVYISMSILTQRILGGSNSKVLSTIMYLVSASILLVPGAAIFGILQAVFYFNGQQFLFISYIAAIIYNVGISILVLYLGKGILREVEM